MRTLIWRLSVTGLAVALGSMLVLVTAATPAAAHAVLLDSSPADGAIDAEAPEEIRLEFNEPVSVPSDGVRLFDAAGAQVPLDRDLAAPPETLVHAIGQELPRGGYILTWRVVSADGHLVRGAFQFFVGDEAGIDDAVIAAIDPEGSAGRWALAGKLARIVAYGSALLAVGVALFWVLVWRRGAVPDGAHAEPAADPSEGVAGEGLRRLAALAAFTGAASAVALLAVQAGSLAAAGLAGIVDAATLGDILTSPFGIGVALRVLALGALGALLWRPQAPPAVGVVAAAALAVGSFVLVGHSAVTEPRWLAWLADAVHIGAAAVWFGGIVALGVVLRRRVVEAGEGRVTVAVVRYSQLAAGALLAVAVSGTALAWLEVRALRALVDTEYGRTLLVKLAVVAAVVAVAAYNRYRLVPAVAGEGTAGAGRRLRRTVTAEAGLMVVVIAVTAVLGALQPGRDAIGVGGVFHAAVPVNDAVLDITVDPTAQATTRSTCTCWTRSAGQSPPTTCSCGSPCRRRTSGRWSAPRFRPARATGSMPGPSSRSQDAGRSRP